MEAYQYIARDQAGMKKQGLKQAIGSSEVLGWLREQGLTPISVKAIDVAKKTKRIVC